MHRAISALCPIAADQGSSRGSTVSSPRVFVSSRVQTIPPDALLAGERLRIPCSLRRNCPYLWQVGDRLLTMAGSGEKIGAVLSHACRRPRRTGLVRFGETAAQAGNCGWGVD